MSLRDAQDDRQIHVKRRSSLCLGLLALVLLPTLAACGGPGGFKPMYAATGGQTVGSRMAQVSVTTIPGRIGQQLRNELIFRTTGGGGETVEKAYRLDIILHQRLTSAQVDAEGNAETQIYHIDADFQLVDNRWSKVVFKGQSFGRASFQRFRTIYSNVRAKRDAEDRTARTIANDIAGRVEAYLSR